MTQAEIEALVEQVGEEILGRLGLPASAWNGVATAPVAPESAWPRPQTGYASALEWVCAGPETTASDVTAACRQARESGVAAVWTPVALLSVAVSALGDCSSRAGALIDYPSGSSSTPARLVDVEAALRLGAEMVNLTLGAGHARGADAGVLTAEVRAAAELCDGAALAVTLEAELLTEKELATAAAAAVAGGADALCSSTGKCGHGFASDRAVAILREIAGGKAVVIAGGRVAGFSHAAALIAAGADRIASDSPLALLATAPRA